MGLIMVCDVILRKKDSKYLAQVKEWPEVIAEESTREAAISQIKMRLSEYLSDQVEVVQIDVPLPVEPKNQWLDKFGCFQDDPTFEDLQTEIEAYRLEIDQALEQGAK